ncbi:hypothetical protein LguiB_003661 [Lonicera macranthoides]
MRPNKYAEETKEAQGSVPEVVKDETINYAVIGSARSKSAKEWTFNLFRRHSRGKFEMPRYFVRSQTIAWGLTQPTMLHCSTATATAAAALWLAESHSPRDIDARSEPIDPLPLILISFSPIELTSMKPWRDKAQNVLTGEEMEKEFDEKIIIAVFGQRSKKIKEVRRQIGPVADKFPTFFSNASILRFLRARNLSTKRAAKMMKDTLKWRLEYKPKKIRWI